MINESQPQSSYSKYNQLFTLLKRKYFLKMNFYVILFFSIHFTPNTIIGQRIFGITDLLVDGKNITLHTLVRGAFYMDSLTKNNIQIIDGGTPITNFTIASKDSNDRSECLSAAFVIDRSGSLGWDESFGAVQESFANLVCGFDGNCDECALVSFSSDVRLDVPLTNDRTEIQNGIYNLQTKGGTALWDAAVVALNELITKAQHNDKFIILFTDGEDVLSKSTADTVLYLAKVNNIKVFTLGLGTGVNRSELQKLALETGGNFYLLPNPNQLFSVMNDIYSKLVRRYTLSEISYQSPVTVPDGSKRNGSLNFKGSSLCLKGYPIDYQYHLSCDSSKIQSIDLSLENVSGQPGSIVPVRLKLQTSKSVSFERFGSMITFDSSLLQLYGYDQAGYLLDGLGVGITPYPSKVHLSTNQSKTFSSSGDLFLFTFRILPVLIDTQVQITIKDWTFGQGCIIPIFHSGSITIKVKPLNMITPLPNEILCAGNSQIIQWVNKNVSTVRIELSNDGGITFSKILADSINASIGSWMWNIPVSQQEGNKYVLRVVDVSNPSTESRTQGTFTIKPPTAILVQPKNQTIKEGQMATFDVTATGVYLKYQWKKDGAKILGMVNSSISISQVQKKDEGNYSVEVTGRCSTVESQPARLTIITTSVNETQLPKDVTLYQNYPNPFRAATLASNPSTEISYSLPEGSDIKLSVVDALGREVAVLANEFKEPGMYTVTFNGEEYPSGVYYYRLVARKTTLTRKMSLVK